MNELELYKEKVFDDIKHIDEYGNEYWFARELMPLLEYSKWENFNNVVKKAVVAYKNSNNKEMYWLSEIKNPIKTGKGKEEFIIDYKLSRYICYLIVQNANPRKKSVTLCQTYFAIQTRRQEINDKEYELLTEDEKRIYQRNLTKKGNYSLNITAKNAGVRNFDKFYNYGYNGLYNVETANDIAKRKDLRYREDILDNIGSDELIANLFRISQTEQKLRKDNTLGEDNTNKIHYNIGKNIRKVIKKNGGTMPEDLPSPEKSLKQIEKEDKNKLVNVEENGV